MARKGQASVEQLIITGLAIGFIAIMFFIALNYASDSTRVSQAKDAMSKLSKGADYVYSLGPGAKESTKINLPEGVQSLNISGNRIHMRLELSSGVTDLFEYTDSELIGSVALGAGTKEITIEATRSGKVRFGESSLECAPASIAMSVEQGENASASFTIGNVGEDELHNISAGIEGEGIEDALVLGQPEATLGVGATGTVYVNFSVPMNKSVDTYSGVVSVEDLNGSECSTVITIFVERFGGPDVYGPLSESINHTPPKPTASTDVEITAFGNDTAKGNSSLEGCQIELDDSGIWNEMDAEDGQFDSPEEELYYNMGTIGSGNHTLSIRCIDEEFNVGDETTYDFSVEQRMLFLTIGGSPSTDEQRWMDWIDTHESGEGYGWGYDVHSRDEVVSGSVDLGEYKAIIMAEAPNSDNDLYWDLVAYKNGGRYMVLMGEAMQYAMPNLDISEIPGVSETTSVSEVRADHYITNGYAIGNTPSITGLSDDVYYHADFIGTNILATGSDEIRATILEGHYVVTFGVTRADSLNSDGDTFATRVLDYAFMGREQDYTGPQIVEMEYVPDPVFDYENMSILATADDSVTGNSAIALCEAKMDGGEWQDMNATDGAYDEVTEEVNYTFGNLEAGTTHTVYVRCIDSFGNVGTEDSVEFDVYGNILFITDYHYLAYHELVWMYWMEEQVMEGNNENYWLYTVARDQDVKSGYTKLRLFKMVIIAGYSTTSNMGTTLEHYTDEDGGYVALVGPSSIWGLGGSGWGWGWWGWPFWLWWLYGGDYDGTQIDIVDNSHELVSGYSTGLRTIYDSTGNIAAIEFNGDGIAERPWSSREVLGQNEHVFIWGPMEPQLFNEDGDLITQRLIDYCIDNSDIGE
jgi:hypothetical protein